MGYKQLSPGLRVGAEVVEQRRQARTGDLGTSGAASRVGSGARSQRLLAFDLSAAA